MSMTKLQLSKLCGYISWNMSFSLWISEEDISSIDQKRSVHKFPENCSLTKFVTGTKAASAGKIVQILEKKMGMCSENAARSGGCHVTRRLRTPRHVKTIW